MKLATKVKLVVSQKEKEQLAQTMMNGGKITHTHYIGHHIAEGKYHEKF